MMHVYVKEVRRGGLRNRMKGWKFIYDHMQIKPKKSKQNILHKYIYLSIYVCIRVTQVNATMMNRETQPIERDISDTVIYRSIGNLNNT